MTAAYILAPYPLSHTFREAADCIAGAGARYLSVAELRGMGLRGMIAFLRSIGKPASLYVALEDRQSESLLPLLLGLAAFSNAGGLWCIDSDLSTRRISRAQILRAICQVASASVLNVLLLARCWCDALWLGRCRTRTSTPSPDSKRILYINAHLWFGVRAGGSVGHIAGVVNALSDAGYQLDLASAGNQVMLRDTVCQHVVAAPKTFGYPQELNVVAYNFHFLKQVRSLAIKGRYAFLYQRMSVMNFVGVALSRMLGIPLVLEYNGSEIWVARNWGRAMRFSNLGLAIEKICLRHAHRVVVVSQVLADELIARGVEPSRIVCYPNCVDPAHFNPERISPTVIAGLRNRYGIPTDATVASFVGTFGTWHGAPVFAAAIKRLVDTQQPWLREHNVRFAMIGDGLKMKEVRQLIGSPDYAPWVVFTGLVPQAETVNYLAASDILIAPHIANTDGSRFFGSPTKLFEYMAMAKGIVASDLDQIGEVLSPATAILTRPGSVDDLVAGIKLLAEQPALRAHLGRNARAELLRRYTWRHHVAQIIGSLGAENPQDKAHVPVPELAR